MAEKKKATRKSRKVSITIPDSYMEQARVIMAELEIPTFSALIRELVVDMYSYITSTEWQDQHRSGEDGNHDGQSL